jgi:hypothetical protein
MAPTLQASRTRRGLSTRRLEDRPQRDAPDRCAGSLPAAGEVLDPAGTSERHVDAERGARDGPLVPTTMEAELGRLLRPRSPPQTVGAVSALAEIRALVLIGNRSRLSRDRSRDPSGTLTRREVVVGCEPRSRSRGGHRRDDELRVGRDLTVRVSSTAVSALCGGPIGA